MILNPNMLFWTLILEYLNIFFTPKIQNYPFLNQSQQERKLIRISGEMYVNRNCNISPMMLSLSSVSA